MVIPKVGFSEVMQALQKLRFLWSSMTMEKVGGYLVSIVTKD